MIIFGPLVFYLFDRPVFIYSALQFKPYVPPLSNHLFAAEFSINFKITNVQIAKVLFRTFLSVIFKVAQPFFVFSAQQAILRQPGGGDASKVSTRRK